MPRKDLTGQIFGRLTVTGIHQWGDKSTWHCVCECGGKSIVRSANLLSGLTKSCGCLRDVARRANKKHGMARTRVYGIWVGMVHRCTSPKCKLYPLYGGRGIGMDPAWKDFRKFYADMGEPPEKHELDRIDGTKGYSKDNCRWATSQQQSMNMLKRNRPTSSRFKGVGYSKTNRNWIARIKFNRKNVHIGCFAREEDAARAYDSKARELFGEFACLNFK
jgi:hypothetical protein